MTVPTLPDNVREARPEQREKLLALAAVREQIDGTQGVLEKLTERRKALWAELAAEGVSWADLGRVSHVADVTVLQAVQGREPKGKRSAKNGAG